MIASHLRLIAVIVLFAGGCGGRSVVPPEGETSTLAGSAPAEAGPPSATLFLVGDAGRIGPERDRLLTHLGRSADSLAQRVPGLPVALVYLGDNVYEVGVRPEELEADTEILAEQVRLGGHGVDVPIYFLPGNHDWGHKGSEDPEGLQRLILQADAIATLADGSGRHARLAPEPGCPGPTTVDLGAAARLLLIDTEWMIREAETCTGRSRSDLLRDLRAGMEHVGDRPVFVLAHHPLASGGPHGSGAGWLRRLWRTVTDPPQDFGSSPYEAMVGDILAAADSAALPRLVLASGHEHSLQVIETERKGVPFVQLVSGSAAKQTGVDAISGTRFASSRPGYMRVDFVGDRVFVTVLTLGNDGNSVGAAWHGELFPGARRP